ncbi:MAG: flagellar basal-body MS-ring/collar protein FliF [Burkholderiales bacterium]
MTRIASLPARQAVGLMVGLAALIAFAIGGWMWAQTPDWRVLYSNLSDRDGGAVVAALGTMNVPYKIAEGGGAIMVPSAQVHDTRLKLASQGLPKGSVVGFELVDAQKFGATQFQEQVNFQRGLEGELARSIQSLAAVAGARVHLAIPKPSVFTRETAAPTASVLVTLHAGRTLDRAQVNGIVHLVASSVPELAVDRVSVLDQNGALLSQRRDGDSGGLDATQLAYVKEVERSTIQRIVDILEPIVGRGNVRAQVTADVDFRRVESVAETYKPNQDPKVSTVRTQQTAESTQQGAGAAGAQGVPGALTNQPPPNASAPIEGKATPVVQPASAGPTSSRKDASVAYEVDKTIQHTRGPSAGLRRLSAAVIVNYKRAPAGEPAAADAKADPKAEAKADAKDAAAKPASTARTPQEMEQIQALVREAMGFSQERGDSLSVANAPFSEPEVAPAIETPWWKSAETIATAKESAKYAAYAALLAWLWFGVARPMLRRASTPVAEPVFESGGSDDSPAPATAHAPPPAIDALARARQVARDDPKIVANVVRSWVTKDE